VAHPIAEFLKNVIPQEHLWKIKLYYNWKTIMGVLNDKVAIVRIDHETLVLKTTHPAWAQELHLLSSMLKQKINTALGSQKIKKILFTTQDTSTSHGKKIQRHPLPTTQCHVAYQPTFLEKAMVKKLHNQELETVFIHYLTRCKQQKEKK